MLRRVFGVLVALSAWYCGMSIRRIAFLGCVWLVILFVVIPTVFRSCSTLQRHMVFLPYVHWPKMIDFEDPESEGLLGTRNFYLTTEPRGKVQVGVWHVLPKYLIQESQLKDRSWFEEKLSDGSPIVIYMHGNTGSRAREHRLHLYQVLQNLNFHVIAFDYRGYADSSPTVPTKTGVVRDAHAVYQYVRSLTHGKDAPIVIYGHSLGTAVSTQFVSELCQRHRSSINSISNGDDGSISNSRGDDGTSISNEEELLLPKALILESPFNNIQDEIKNHPMTFLWRKMPWFDWFFAGTLHKNDVGFMSDQQIVHIHLPILILHAKDDAVVPYQLGEKLYQVALTERRHLGRKRGEGGQDASASEPPAPLQFVSFEEEEALGHTYIYSSEKVPRVLEEFVKTSVGLAADATPHESSPKTARKPVAARYSSAAGIGYKLRSSVTTSN